MQKNNHNWINQNRELVKRYRGQWIAYNYEDGIIGSNQELEKLTENLKEKDYTLWLVPKYWGQVLKFLPIHFKSVSINEWSPLYRVVLKAGSKSTAQDMLVDSGADLSLIPFTLGKKLGLIFDPFEKRQKALGVGGEVEYVVREIEFKIDEYSFQAPIAWVLNPECEDVILGREVVFDTFDIEFKQADEEIVFKLRKDKKAKSKIQ
jgi:hypothetical protein